MEASSKDLARARFKQQRRDAFRDGRGRGGRGRGRGRSGPFDNVDEDEDEAPEATQANKRNAPRPEIDLPPDEDDERLDADGNVRPRSKGADLRTLFAECDQAALPRQHATAYLDPSWAVDDLAALERVARGDGTGNLGELSLDPAALERRLRVLPLADLLGLSEDYREYLGGDGSEDGATDDAAPAETERGGEDGGTDAVPATIREPEVDHLLGEGDAGSEGDTASAARTFARVSTGEETRRDRQDAADDDAELDALLDGLDGPVGEKKSSRRKSSAGAVPAAAASRDDDDAFLDELLG
jgi:hypothetical protein